MTLKSVQRKGDQSVGASAEHVRRSVAEKEGSVTLLARGSQHERGSACVLSEGSTSDGCRDSVRSERVRGCRSTTAYARVLDE